ncbi:type II toxin-antitoxin system RelE/ParE family toxin [Rhizobium sp. AAP116]|uniref:type II toxin-antitoxin system RelE/ParE family toxin n=1 Tax=Rhizobium sp. AAP116 TaxID=1523429 RepID=UPI000A9CDE65|nr:type II toxin-antitoxin system RelE/ParE family toxin [Rhizobium sp. AAP116]
MIVRWTRQAIRDRASIFDYLVAKNPLAALSIDHSFEQAAIQLGQFPHAGKNRPDPWHPRTSAASQLSSHL